MRETIGKDLGVASLLFLVVAFVTGCQNTHPIFDSAVTIMPEIEQSATLTTAASRTENARPGASPAPATPTPQFSTPTKLPMHIPSPTLDPAVQTVFSPDYQWVAKLYHHNVFTDGTESIEVHTLDGDTIWTIIVQRTLPMGDPHPSLRIHSWSPDSSKLYYFDSFGFDGYMTLWNGFDLSQLDIKTGIQTSLVTSERLISFSFSPTGTKLAYILAVDNPRRIYIRDLATNQLSQASIGLPEILNERPTQAGWILWSPDEEDLALFTEAEEQMELLHIELPSLRRSSLIDFWYNEIQFQGWALDGRLILYWPYEDAVSYLDLETQTFSDLMTATPESR
jgi:hypothetical protein